MIYIVTYIVFFLDCNSQNNDSIGRQLSRGAETLDEPFSDDISREVGWYSNAIGSCKSSSDWISGEVGWYSNAIGPCKPFSDGISGETPLNSTDCFLCSYKEDTIDNLNTQIQPFQDEIKTKNQEIEAMKLTIQEYRNKDTEAVKCNYCSGEYENLDVLQDHFKTCTTFLKIIGVK